MNSFAASSNSTSVGLVDGLRQGWLLRKSALPIAAATLAFVALLSSFQYVVRQGVEAGDARRADAARQSQELWRSAYAKPALTPQQANQVIVGGSVHAVSKALR